MSDLISRQAAYEALSEYYHHKTEMQHKALREALGMVPSAQPERKKGKWMPENRTMDAFWVCSVCRFPSEAHSANILYKFCPNCGADMRSGEGERDETD